MRRRRLVCVFLLCFAAGLAAGGCGRAAVNEIKYSTYNEINGSGEASPCLGGDLLQHFISTHPGNDVIKCAQADLNNDNTEDLVVVYSESREKNNMLVVLDLKGEYQCTNEVPAPVSNQVISFKDIDNKPPLEFIVQGMKGANVGYAIYRVEGTVLEDLFGEGMKDCC
jgi:hypothetical protein